MKTSLKTLLLASAVALSLSACAGDKGKNHAGMKDNPNCLLRDGKCPIAANLDKAQDQLSAIKNSSKDLPKDADNAAIKAHLDKVNKQVGEVSKTLQDAQKEIAKAKRSLGKKEHGKGHAKKEEAAKDAAAPAAPAKK